MKVKKCVLKALFVFLVIFTISSINMKPVYCINEGAQPGVQDQGKGSGEFDPSKYKPQSQTNVSDGDELLTSVNKIVGVVTWIGMILSVTIFVTIGVKYMLGSVEEKADYKKTLVPYLIGAILVFGITTIVEILSTIATSI